MTNHPAQGKEQHYTLTAEQEATLPNRVKAVLASHVGRGNAITAKQIAECLKIHDPDGRKVRAAIALLRADDEPVCADPSCGFWWCQSLSEGIAFMDRLDAIHKETEELKLHFRRAVRKHFGWDPDQPRLGGF